MQLTKCPKCGKIEEYTNSIVKCTKCCTIFDTELFPETVINCDDWVYQFVMSCKGG